MCGILYAYLKKPEKFINFNKTFDLALDKMSSRGPDSRNSFIHKSHYIGHVRLAILGLDPKYSQPYGIENKKLIFNGEIYNFKDLDHNAQSDTNVLYDLLSSGDSEIFKKIRGVFSFGFFDFQKDNIFFARDFFGEKPLYYFVNDDLTIFSSSVDSIRSILSNCNITCNANLDAIKYDYLLFGYIREPETIYKNILVVPSGHIARFINGEIEFKPIDFGLKNSSIENFQYTKNALISTDVASTLLLSSGVDSTFILELIKENKLKVNLSTYKASNYKSDESNLAIANLKKMGYYDFDIVGNATEFQLSNFFKSVDQPTTDGMNLFNILINIKNKDKVIFSGLGGDEIYGGYNSFKYLRFRSLLYKVGWINKVKRFRVLHKILKCNSVSAYYFIYRFNFKNWITFFDANPEVVKKSYDRFLVSINSSFKIVPYYKNEFLLLKHFETFDYMRNQLLRDSDTISMFLSKEIRNPLLDPDKFLLIPDQKKYLKEKLKTNNIYFPNKRGFEVDQKSFTLSCDDTISLSNLLELDFSEMKQNKSLYYLVNWFKEREI